MQSHYYHLYYPDYPLKMSIGTAVEAVKEGASEPNSTEKVVKEGGILQDVGQEEVKTSTTKKNALEAEKKEDHQLRARKVEAKTNPPEQGTKEVKGLEQVTSPTDQDQEKDILKGDLYLHLWEHFVSISGLVVTFKILKKTLSLHKLNKGFCVKAMNFLCEGPVLFNFPYHRVLYL